MCLRFALCRVTVNHQVAGSSPAAGAKRDKGLAGNGRLLAFRVATPATGCRCGPQAAVLDGARAVPPGHDGGGSRRFSGTDRAHTETGPVTGNRPGKSEPSRPRPPVFRRGSNVCRGSPCHPGDVFDFWLPPRGQAADLPDVAAQ